MGRTKLSDIAKALELSKTTISKVLNGYPDVNALTRKRVLDYIKEVGFEANTQASFLRTKETKTVALILPQISHDFFNSILEGMLKIAQQTEYTFYVACSNESYELETKLISKFLKRNVDAIFLSISRETRNFDHLRAIREEGKILVLYDKIEKTIDCPKIIIDDRKASFTATEHLIKKGCRKILHFRGGFLPQISIDRYLGYRDALDKYDIPFDKERIFICENANEKDGFFAAKKALESGIDFDGLFTISDLLAIGAIQFFKKNKIQVPEDISVVGFSNWKLSSFTYPTITTVDQPGNLMGEKIFQTFLTEKSLKKQGLDPENREIKLPSKLIIRESS